MAGKPKAGLDYAGWSVDLFDGDTKIDKLLDAQGWVGFGVYFYLCQMAYKFDGYFYRWCFDDASTTARRMGGGLRAKTVEETVRYCLHIGLFDKGLYDRWNILTSRGIQRRFCQAASGRRVKSVILEFWLLDDEESKGFEKCTQNQENRQANDNLQVSNSHLQDANNPKSKVKESKGKESKVDGLEQQSSSKAAGIAPSPEKPFIELLLNDGTLYPIYTDQVKEWSALYGSVDVPQQLRNMKGWLASNPKKRKTRSGILRFINSWLSREQDRGGRSPSVNREFAARPANYQKESFAEIAERMSREEENIANGY